ncbi:hypothetical protein TURU_005393 [Turdus rufiventris]|nr:hypothetical protein TURU_005393 [Turdus rufiventris]
MGLCKCPKRRVTTLFCFEHRVNVCESCLVSAHPKCIVRSYLQWLQDSDYSPQCPLCQGPLGERETVRLVCYGSAPRKPLGGRESWSPPDRDEDKYRRRPLAWLPPKLRCRVRGVPRRPLLALCLGGAAAFALLLLLLGSLGRGGADSDPALEPLNNPHVRVGH